MTRRSFSEGGLAKAEAVEGAVQKKEPGRSLAPAFAWLRSRWRGFAGAGEVSLRRTMAIGGMAHGFTRDRMTANSFKTLEGP